MFGNWLVALLTVFLTLQSFAQVSREEYRQRLTARSQQLENARAILKQEFIGIDKQIDTILDSIRSWYVLPEAQQKPLIVNLWGPTGVGKTSVVRRMVELLSVQNVFFEFDMRNPDFKYLSDRSGEPQVLLFDEFQHARTIQGKVELPQNPEMRMLMPILSDGIFKTPTANYFSTINDLESIQRMLDVGVISWTDESFQTGDYRTMNNTLVNIRNSIASVRNTMKLTDPMEVILEKLRTNPTYLPALIAEARKLPPQTTHDFRKALIFVVGNLDEAYRINGIVSSDYVSADELHEYTKRVSVTAIKAALGKRFREEEIARLGNIHVAYPTLSELTFRNFISVELGKIQNYNQKLFKIKIEFSSSLKDLLYSEGVIPAQGLRPLATSISEIVASNLSNLVVKGMETPVDTDRISVSLDKTRPVLIAEGFDLLGRPTFKTERLLNLRIREAKSLRHSPEVQSRIARHEAGHAVVGILLQRKLPEVIRSSSDTGAEGLVRFGAGEGFSTKETLVAEMATGLAGRAAEEFFYGEKDISTGASSDLMTVTGIAENYVKENGGGQHLASADTLGGIKGLTYQDDRSMESLVRKAYALAQLTLLEQRDLLIAISKHLEQNESLETEDLIRMLYEKYKGPKQDLDFISKTPISCKISLAG